VAPEPSQYEKDAVHLKAGDHVGAYEIIAPLGAGGMGVVFKARDAKLERLVALKFLRAAPLDGDSPSARLLREAKNASALNHPHIATIYEVGESVGRAYIAMEFVEGRPLSIVLERDSLAPETAVRYGLEIASALAHAHDRGIVHRDLKPANVMITAAGSVKVLDFGLARRMPGDNPNAVTVSQKEITEESSVSGTLLYMAPETLRGEQPDARTDIWSLGAVLYEMVIGRPPFEGRTAYEISSAILREPPKSFPSHVPLRFQAVIQRCLAKEREHRYQRASEVHAALETIGADVITPPASSSGTVPVTAGTPPAAASGGRGKRFAFVALGLVVLAAVGWGGYELYRAKSAAPAPASSDQWTQITDFADSAVSPAVSPDGKVLTFIRGQNTFFGEGQIEAKILPSGDPVELTHDGLRKMSPQFSADGSTIAYTTYTGTDWDTWSVPLLGGDARKMLANAEGLTWIGPDQLLFSQIINGSHMSVVTSPVAGDPRRSIYVPPRERGMAHRSAISPDRNWVLLASMDNGGWLPCRLVPFDGSNSGKPVGPPGASCTYVGWSPDGKWMYLNSETGGRFHLWRQRYPDGQPEQLTSGATEEEGIALAPDGSSLITSVGQRESTLSIRDSKGQRQVSSEGFADDPQFSRDGHKLYYVVRRHGLSGRFRSGELSVADLDSGRTESVLPGTDMSGYSISPDGKQVVYAAVDPRGLSNLWLASLGREFPPRRIASSVNEDEPYWTDSGGIVFRASEGSENFIYRMKSDGGGREKANPDPVLEMLSVSPTAQWAVVWHGVKTDSLSQVIAVPLDGSGSPMSVCGGYCNARWNANGHAFVVVIDSMEGTYTMVVPLSSVGGLPVLPPNGLVTRADLNAVKGAKVMPGWIYAGAEHDQFALRNQEVHRNLYRIPLAK
jgi:Tol biopolymer transport system component/tRNA A-37 threonylcarbamoyl transferase component Bud32